MVRSLTLILSGAFFIATTQGGLQLVPTVSEYEADGTKLTHLEFSDDGKTVIYQSPRGWDYSGDATQLTLRPPNKAQAEATIITVPLAQPGRFDDQSLRKLVSEALAMVPKGGEDISVVSQERNPLLIQGKETFLITLRYTLYGHKYGRSILFVNRGNEQIRAQLTCREADFEELHLAFFRSQFTWQNL